MAEKAYWFDLKCDCDPFVAVRCSNGHCMAKAVLFADEYHWGPEAAVCVNPAEVQPPRVEPAITKPAQPTEKQQSKYGPLLAMHDYLQASSSVASGKESTVTKKQLPKETDQPITQDVQPPTMQQERPSGSKNNVPHGGPQNPSGSKNNVPKDDQPQDEDEGPQHHISLCEWL
ncbi:hypothetical protein ZHAS_00009354 [Anopheles sinensis]|uniref:Uncharacterized protein n=1 Tax=Anopheles sinensis TaxID=74873 RepID=A0A084VUS9_ANOSI|nr:hypothetical protein ZHAS_00009354 [Anopheles sinensis]